MTPMRRIISFFLTALCLAAFAKELICTDDICYFPTGEATEASKEPSPSPAYQVLSPVPETVVSPLPQAPRLDTLDGKTIALVGGSFMASVTHPELKRLILAEYPTAKVPGTW